MEYILAGTEGVHWWLSALAVAGVLFGLNKTIASHGTQWITHYRTWLFVLLAVFSSVIVATVVRI